MWPDTTTDDGNGYARLFVLIDRKVSEVERLSGLAWITTPSEWFGFVVRCRTFCMLNERTGE